ncbi:MAG TPA: RidA family protein [Candidatus Acidoferrum sp.]|nr:RidA family protein [Candidatus Acidoferrum sp.]
MTVYEKLQELKIELPVPTAPVAAFVPTVRTGNLLFVSGHIAKREGTSWAGQLGSDISVVEGRKAARNAAVDLLATLHHELGSLAHVKRIVKLLCFVNSAPQFTEQHLVANGASELLQDVFGKDGAHARSAVGVAQLPLGSCVEIEVVAEVA